METMSLELIKGTAIKQVREKLGKAARNMQKTMKNFGPMGQYRSDRVFHNDGTPCDITGHLFTQAFGDAATAMAAYVSVRNADLIGGLPRSVIEDLQHVNDMKHCKNRRRSYIKLLRELADFCLDEGQYDSRLFTEE